MELRRRFVFRGNAAAFGGRIVRPRDVVLEMPGASSLPVSGGRSVAKIGPKSFDFLTFKSASTFAEGLFDSLEGAVALSNHKIREEALTTSTTVRGEVNVLTVGARKRLKVNRLSAELLARSPLGGGQPSISLGDVAAEGVTIDRFKLVVDVDCGVFNRCATHAALLSACDDPRFVKKHGTHLFLTTDFEGRPAPPQGRLVPGCETIYATVVRSLRWDGPEPPRDQAFIDGHSVVVREFGKIFFGELLITTDSRRLTMMRLELGSDEGGGGGGPDVDAGGGWSP